MRAIIVDDEPLMVRKFVRLTKGIRDLHIVDCFDCAEDAILYAEEHVIEVAFLDISLPLVNGIDLAKELRRIRKDILIVFITAYDKYIRDANEMGADYYVVKPYTKEILETMIEKIKEMATRQQRQIYIQTFGRFVVKKDGKPIRINGYAKEILAFLVSRRGKEVSNEEIFCTIWEDRPCNNRNMSVYFNAMRRLRRFLEEAGIPDLVVNGNNGKLVDTSLFDCDYYAWLDKNEEQRGEFEGEFLSEYSWAETILADMIHKLFASD